MKEDISTISWKFSHGKRGQILQQVKVELIYIHDNENVIYSVCEIGEKYNFSATEIAMVATAASELATNILRFAKKGTLYITIFKELHAQKEKIGIEILAVDQGPGIEDIEKALRENYSTMMDSLGLGLPSVRRLMDEFYIESIMNEGTRILVYKWRAG